MVMRALLGHPRLRSMRAQLLAAVLLPPLVAVPLLIALLAVWGSVYFDRLLIGKVRSDLAVAHGQLEQLMGGVGRQVEALAGAERLSRALREADAPAAVAALLRDARAGAGLDFLLLVDEAGRVRAASGGAPRDEPYPLPPSWQAAPGAHADIDLLAPQQLGLIDPLLREKARTPLLDTPAAAPTAATEETRGLVAHAIAPVPAATQTPGSARLRLVGGLLLNKNLDFVDRIDDIVYPAGSLPLGSAGTVTLFLGDVRIATNVRRQEGERAIGTRVSARVREQVLGEGRPWLDRAFVVNDWYVSAYEPVLDSAARRVGMLYVGYLEAPLRHARLLALAAVAALFLFAAALGAWISLRLARRVSAPVERLQRVMADIAAGQTQARVGLLDGAAEVVALGAHFDHLLDRLAGQTAALQRWGAELDRLVAERTAELAAANDSLRSAQQQLVLSEKLAAIGQLAAGIAHEVNNPLAVIQGNLDLMRDALGEAAEPAHTEIRLIQDQVYRIRQIVTQLLQFARPVDASRPSERLQLDDVLRGSLPLVAHQLRRRHIALTEAHAPAPAVRGHRHELQQVLINLIVNALQALQGRGGGTLWLSTGPAQREGRAGACMRVADDGPGIAPAERERLFTPFFTTKPGSGHGLGLWVSLNLVQRVGGRLEVEHPPAGGTVFTVWLPADEAG